MVILVLISINLTVSLIRIVVTLRIDVKKTVRSLLHTSYSFTLVPTLHETDDLANSHVHFGVWNVGVSHGRACYRREIREIGNVGTCENIG